MRSTLTLKREYKKEDYELESGFTFLSYSELYDKAEDGAFYELVSGPINQYIGTRVLVKKTLYGTIVKYADHHDSDDSSSLVTPYAAITSGRFKRLKKKKSYVEISLNMALSSIMSGVPVFYKHSDIEEYVEIKDKYMDFEEMEIFDFDDLSRVSFFIKPK